MTTYLKIQHKLCPSLEIDWKKLKGIVSAHAKLQKAACSAVGSFSYNADPVMPSAELGQNYEAVW